MDGIDELRLVLRHYVEEHPELANYEDSFYFWLKDRIKRLE